jgi:thiamine-phosphate pyrophosphorylase
MSAADPAHLRGRLPGRLYFVTMDGVPIGHLEQVEAACRAGIRLVQLRMKDASDQEMLAAALEARRICDAWEAVLIINDRVEVALASGADGVHVGLEDMPVGEVRRMLGVGKIVGGTANTAEDVMGHYHHGADYVGVGPFRYTTTKKNLSPVLGIAGYRGIMGRLGIVGIEIPVIAIGGIGPGDVGGLLETGVYGVAFSGMFVHSADRTGLIRSLEQEIKKVIPC